VVLTNPENINKNKTQLNLQSTNRIPRNQAAFPLNSIPQKKALFDYKKKKTLKSKLAATEQSKFKNPL
jgi:hypothetical protein